MSDAMPPEPAPTASAVLERIERMPEPARPAEWLEYSRAAKRWFELASEEELRAHASSLVRKLTGPRELPPQQGVIVRVLAAAVSAPAAASQPEWLLGSEVLSEELRSRVPAKPLKRILTGLVRRTLEDGAPVSSRRFFELIGWLAELPGVEPEALAGKTTHYVRQRLAAMDPIEQTEWVLGLPAELPFMPRWPAFRLSRLVEALDRQTAPITLRDPGRIAPVGSAELPADAVERLFCCLVAGGFAAEAVPWAEHAARASGWARHAVAWGRILVAIGETERAYEVLGEAMEAHPENAPLRMEWAAVAARLGRHAEIARRAPAGEPARRALARSLAVSALAPGEEAYADAAVPTLAALRRRLGIEELVDGLDLPGFRERLGLPPAAGGAPTGDPARRWLMLGYQTRNIGDEIQGVAAARFLPRVDGLLDRDDLAASGAAGGRAILNGWYMEPDLEGRYRWPPPPELDGLWVSVHIHPVHAPALLTPEGVEYFRSTGAPIGCRDRFTLELLRAAGVEAELTGCLTLTLPRIERRRGTAVCFSDLGAEVEEALAPAVERQLGARPNRLAHGLSRGSLVEGYQARVEAAVELLAVYASAALVVTSRLHAALPCYAMGIPVVMVLENPADPRFAGLLDPIPTASPAECLDDPRRVLDLARRPQPIPRWTEELEARVREFVGRG